MTNKQTEAEGIVFEFDPAVPEDVKLGSPDMFGVEYAAPVDPGDERPD